MAEPKDDAQLNETESMEETETGAGAVSQNLYDEEIDEEVSRMMGEGGVAPPVRPKSWRDWAQSKAELKNQTESP